MRLQLLLVPLLLVDAGSYPEPGDLSISGLESHL